MLQDQNVVKHFRHFNEMKKICIYSNSDAANFKAFLDFIDADYTAEDVGGNPIAPQMWRFYNNSSKH